jgi:hypothetical protein
MIILMGKVIPADIGMEFVQNPSAAFSREGTEDITWIAFHLRPGKHSRHCFAYTLHEHFNCRNANPCDLPQAAIPSVIPIKPAATQTRNNLHSVYGNPAVLSQKIKY